MSLGVLIFSTVVVGVVLVVSWSVRKAIIRKAERLLHEGVPARARVLFMRQTGSYTRRTVGNFDPEVDIDLEIQPEPDASSEHANAFRGSTRLVLPVAIIPKVQPGAIVPVKFDPADPSRVALDLDEVGV